MNHMGMEGLKAFLLSQAKSVIFILSSLTLKVGEKGYETNGKKSWLAAINTAWAANSW